MTSDINSSHIGQLLPLIITALEEIDPESSPSDSKVLEMLSVVLTNPPSVFFKVIEEDGKIVSFMGGIAEQGLLVSDLYAHILIAYTRPRYRGNNHIIDLFHNFERWAEDIGAHKILFNSILPEEALNNELISELGLSRYGVNLIKDIT